MQTEWYQVEFYSGLDKKWVPLFAKCDSVAEAERKAKVLQARWQVVKVTMRREVVADDGLPQISGRDEGTGLRFR